MNTLTSNAGRTWLVMPGELRKQGAKLLHQQCWCWGQDIRRETGNLLLENGFERRRPPEGRHGSSTYYRAVGETSFVALWGFGVCWCEKGRGRIFIGRYSLLPRYSPEQSLPEDVWKIEQIRHPQKESEGFHPPLDQETCACAVGLLAAALRWISEYEAEVLAHSGTSYRHMTLKQWPHAVAAPEKIPDMWRDLSKRCVQETRLLSRHENAIIESRVN